MAFFSYTGRDNQGKSTSGVLEGLTEDSVAKQLLQTGIVPLEITSFVEKKDPFNTLFRNLGKKLPTLQDLSLFSRQMYSLTRSGVPIIHSIEVVAESTQNLLLQSTLKTIVIDVQGGQSLSIAMRKHPDIFPNLMTALVNVGENSGSLDIIFKQISVYFEKEGETRKLIKSAMRYPMTVLIVIVIAVIIINIVVIPAFASFFKQFGATLPLPTRILMATSNFMLHYWFILLAIVIASISSWIMYLNTSEGRFFWDKWKLKLPIVGSIFFRSLLARFSRSFALSIQTGVPLMESIGLIAKATDNSYVSEKIINMRQNIERGESLTQAAVNSKMFNPLVLQMLTIGEETGEIDRLLDDVAKFYEDEVDYEVKRIGAAIEPILISVIAILVLILALGVFLPMWDISKAAMSKPG